MGHLYMGQIYHNDIPELAHYQVIIIMNTNMAHVPKDKLLLTSGYSKFKPMSYRVVYMLFKVQTNVLCQTTWLNKSQQMIFH